MGIYLLPLPIQLLPTLDHLGKCVVHYISQCLERIRMHKNILNFNACLLQLSSFDMLQT
jgi:hypothetical protein